ncbi:MAG: ABC transporter substrate binding protein, partial [Clostridiales bacterium]
SHIGLLQGLAPKYGVKVITKGISAASDMAMACDTILSKVDCMLNLTDNMVVSNMPILLEKAKERKIPVIGSEEEQVKKGCLASEGLDYFSLGIETGKMAAKILNGESAAQIPVGTVKDSSLFVNKAVLQDLGLTLPKELAKRAAFVK